MDIGEKRQGAVVTLSPKGPIDNTTSPAFQAKLLGGLASEGAIVIVDMAGVEYISSAGLATLMMGSKQSKAIKGRIAVCALKPVVKEIFDISRFTQFIEIFPTEAEALAKLR